MITKPFKIKRKDYSNIYYLADAHESHNRNWLYEPRGFNNIQDHDEWILNQLYSLSSDDLLINLGDFTLNSTVEQTLEILNNIKAKHWKVWGNHASYTSKIYFKHLDKFWKNYDMEEFSPEDDLTNRRISVYPLSISTNPDINNLSEDEYPNLEDPTIKNSKCKLTFFGESILFNIDNNSFFAKHMVSGVWPRYNKDTPTMHLHGHSHGSYHGSQPNDLNSGKRLDVGIDNAIKYNGTCFFKYEEVLEIMKHKNFHKVDHH
jgi:hypothetical protein